MPPLPRRRLLGPPQGYHLNADLADRAIGFLADAAQVAPDKPFYLHYCPGATHAPHHVPREWADLYAGQFDDGWDACRQRVFARQKELGIMSADAELSRPDPDVPAWDSLPADARRLAARMMEVFAGFLSHTDHHLGRVIDFLKETGQFENTLIMLVSDNGASAEGGVQGTTNELQFFNNAPETLEESLRSIDELGGPDTFNHYLWGWTWAGNTPFRRWKRETYLEYDVLPIDGSAAARLMVERPQVAAPRNRYVYRPGTQTVPAWVSPRLLNRPHSITADVRSRRLGLVG